MGARSNPGLKARGPSFARRDARGDFWEIVSGPRWRTIIWGRMRRGATMGNHYHKETEAYFFLVRGKAEILERRVRGQGLRRVVLSGGEGVPLARWWSHRIRYLASSEFLLLKSRVYTSRRPDLYEFPVLRGT